MNEALHWKIEYACLESSVFSFDAILRYDCNYKQSRTFLPPEGIGNEFDIGAEAFASLLIIMQAILICGQRKTARSKIGLS